MEKTDLREQKRKIELEITQIGYYLDLDFSVDELIKEIKTICDKCDKLECEENVKVIMTIK
jgi:uncharacterized protein YicC (UPF0701 family)